MALGIFTGEIKPGDRAKATTAALTKFESKPIIPVALVTKLNFKTNDKAVRLFASINNKAEDAPQKIRAAFVMALSESFTIEAGQTEASDAEVEMYASLFDDF